MNLFANCAIPLVIAVASEANAQLALPSVFSDHMVLQRDMPLPVWGKGSAGQQVVVEIVDATGGQVASATGPIAVDGRWKVQLPALGAHARALTLRVRCGSESISRTDVLVGEVWLCGGQSNMEWPVGASLGGTEFAASLPSTIRCFTAPHDMAVAPLDEQPAQWVVASPANAQHFTAVGSWFASKVGATLDVPVGLLSINWGGSLAESWVPVAAAARDTLFGDSVAKQQTVAREYEQQSAAEKQLAMSRATDDYQKAIAQYWNALEVKEPGFQGSWQRAEVGEAQGWSNGVIPGQHGSAAGTESLATFDGGTWWRRTIEIPTSWIGRDLRLALGPIDDSDVVWVSGIEVGRTTGLHSAPRNYVVPASAVTSRSLELAIFMLDTGGAGGMTGAAERIAVRAASTDGLSGGDAQPISLAGSWQWKRGIDGGVPVAPAPPVGASHPLLAWNAWGSMWNAMMAPVAGFGIRGAIWYQGESNADRAQQYRALLPLLIRSWREAWREGDFPFGIVQLASFQAASNDPVEGTWAELRDAQLNTLRAVPACGLAVTLDVGDAADIHPRNKQVVGSRLAGWALAQVYGKGGEWSGPLYLSAVARGSQLVLSFDHASGLTTVGGTPLDGFAVAGSDGIFVWGNASIEGSTVVVSHPSIARPTAVRYAWSCNPVRANLINGAGLPASPFATDRPASPSNH